MRLTTLRKTLAADLGAGLTTALVTIPDGMASAILAGVSPIHGLYALMVGTPTVLILKGRSQKVWTTRASR